MTADQLYRYRGQVVHVVDGDTLDVLIDLGYDVRRLVRVRLEGIDCPEVRGPSRERGLAAKARAAELAAGAGVFLHSTEYDKYGRAVARVWLPSGELLADVLRREGHVA